MLHSATIYKKPVSLALQKLRSASTFQIALLISIALHASLITIRFVSPKSFDRLFNSTPLEVILVNTHADQAPQNPQSIAQVNLQGGGNSSKADRSQTPLPVSIVRHSGNHNLNTNANKLEQIKAEQQVILVRVKQQLALLESRQLSQKDTTGQNVITEERRQRLLDIVGEVEAKINETNARPIKRYIGPSTRKAEFAEYYDKVRRKIEETGTNYFPTYQGKKLYGELIMEITIDKNGQVLNTILLQSSGNSELDRQAQQIVAWASGFGEISAAMQYQTDELAVISRFIFDRNNNLSTQLQE